MVTIVLVLSVAFGFLAPVSAHAEFRSFFFRHSDTPITVPGGSTSFFLDGNVPTATTPSIDDHTVSVDAAASFPNFTSTAVGADTTLLPIASVLLNLSANQKMRGCADVSADLFRVDGGGSVTMIGNGTVIGAAVVQGKSGGTVGSSPVRVEFNVSDTSIPNGEGISITASLTNHCSVKRHVFLAYDADTAPTRVRFQCCFTAQARCAAAKIKAASKKAKCLLGLKSKQAATGTPTDPDRIQKCQDVFSQTFAKLDAKGDCITSGDAGTIEPVVDAFVADVDGALNSTGPPTANKCQAGKISAAINKTTCLLALNAKVAAKGDSLDPLKVQKCVDKFVATFTKLESRGDCLTTADTVSIEAKIDPFVDGVASVLVCPCP